MKKSWQWIIEYKRLAKTDWERKKAQECEEWHLVRAANTLEAMYWMDMEDLKID